MAAGVLQVDGIIPCISVAVQAYRLRLVSRVRIPGQEAACRRAVVSRAQVLVSRQGIGVLPAVQVWVREIGLYTTFFYTPIDVIRIGYYTFPCFSSQVCNASPPLRVKF